MSTLVLLCGVGGQGTILGAHILAQVALAEGMDVKVSEIHGMAQRGGAVTTVVNFGDSVNSMVSDIGSADIIVSFELIEALRNLPQLKESGVLLVSDEVIKPASVLTGKKSIPSDASQTVLDAGGIIVPAESMAREAGNIKASNVVLLGALSALMDFSPDVWEDVISKSVPPKTVEVNKNAFKAGRAFALEHERS